MVDEHLKKIQSDIDNMNKVFAGQGTEPPPTDPPGTDPPGTQAPGTEAPSTQSPMTTAVPSTEVATTSAPTTEVPEDKDKIIEDLRTKLAEKESGPKTKAPKTEVPTTEAPLSLDEQDFIGDIDPEDLMRDKDQLNKMFNKIFQMGVNTSRKVLGEGVLRQIPDIVKTNIVMVNNLQEASKKFYKENKDLEPFKKVVATVFEETAAENPGKNYSEILEKVGPEVRKRLDLQKKATNPKPKDGDKPPRLPKKGKNFQRSNEPPSTDPLQAELDEMNKSLGGN